MQQGTLKQLSQLAETKHYIQRAIKHAQKHSERLKHVQICQRLSNIFPDLVEQCQGNELSYSYSFSDLQNVPTMKQIQETISDKTSVKQLTEAVYSYVPSKIPATFQGSSIKLSDLRSAATTVSEDISSMERELRHSVLSIPKTRHSLNTRDIFSSPGHRRSHHRTKSTPSHASYITKEKEFKCDRDPVLGPLLSSEIADEHFLSSDRNTLFPRKQVKLRTKTINDVFFDNSGSTMKDLIEAFASGQLQFKSESVYLNYTYPDKWSPYDLTIVPKNKMNSEHFVVSKFGIIQVYSDKTTDFQSFADWLREASLYNILRKIPFIHHYLAKKAIRVWHRNVKFTQLAKIHSRVSQISIRFFPDFANALLKIQNLSEELLTISFNNVSTSKCYDMYLENFELSLQDSQSKAQRYLQKYFKYCRRIITGVIQSSQSRVLELKTEKCHKPFVSDLPLSIQKDVHLKLEHDLKVAVHQSSKLVDFVYLSEQIVFSCLLNLSRQEAHSWSMFILALNETSVNSNRISSHVVPTTENLELNSAHTNQDMFRMNALLHGSFSFNESGM